MGNNTLTAFKTRVRTNISLKGFIFICLFSLAVVFNYFIFGQFEIMLRNQADFGISASEVAGTFILIAFLVLVVMIILLSALRFLSPRVFSYTCAVMLGLLLSAYAQVLFMNKVDKMAVAGTMMRETIPEFILNFLIHVLIVLAPVLLLRYARKKKVTATAKAAFLLAILVLGMQCAGLFSTVQTVKLPLENNALYYFSIDEQLKLSKNDNVLVFVLDRFDTRISNKIFERHPESMEIYGGFTYYTNNVSEYPGTFPSVTSMLTDMDFDIKTNRQIEYMEKAWDNPVLFGALKEQNYKVNGLLDANATFYDFRDVADKFDNVRKMEPENRVVRRADFYSAMMKFSLMRQSPDALKWFFVNKRYYNIADYCVDILNTPDYYPRTVSPSADLYFYDMLTSKTLSADEEKNVFSFIHLQATHAPYEYDENLNKLSASTALITLANDEKAITQTRGTFKILSEYFDQMKALGIYEDATIIILGDHGSWNNTGEKLKDISLTSLLIKEKGRGSEPLQTSAAELSNKNLNPSILEIIGATEAKGENKSYNDIIAAGGIQSPRYLYNVRWTNLNSCTYLCTYEITGDASKIENWKKIKHPKHGK